MDSYEMKQQQVVGLRLVELGTRVQRDVLERMGTRALAGRALDRRSRDAIRIELEGIAAQLDRMWNPEDYEGDG